MIIILKSIINKIFTDVNSNILIERDFPLFKSRLIYNLLQKVEGLESSRNRTFKNRICKIDETSVFGFGGPQPFKVSISLRAKYSRVRKKFAVRRWTQATLEKRIISAGQAGSSFEILFYENCKIGTFFRF